MHNKLLGSWSLNRKCKFKSKALLNTAESLVFRPESLVIATESLVITGSAQFHPQKESAASEKLLTATETDACTSIIQYSEQTNYKIKQINTEHTNITNNTNTSNLITNIQSLSGADRLSGADSPSNTKKINSFQTRILKFTNNQLLIITPSGLILHQFALTNSNCSRLFKLAHTHICKQDHYYLGIAILSETKFYTYYRITGPNKNLIITTNYYR